MPQDKLVVNIELIIDRASGAFKWQTSGHSENPQDTELIYSALVRVLEISRANSHISETVH